MLYQQQFVYVNCFHFFTIYEIKDLNFLINFRSTLLSKSSTVEESSSKIKMISIHELSVFLHFINFCIVRRPHLFHTSDKFELRQAVGSFSNVWKALHSICFLILPVVTDGLQWPLFKDLSGGNIGIIIPNPFQENEPLFLLFKKFI